MLLVQQAMMILFLWWWVIQEDKDKQYLQCALHCIFKKMNSAVIDSVKYAIFVHFCNYNKNYLCIYLCYDYLIFIVLFALRLFYAKFTKIVLKVNIIIPFIHLSQYHHQKKPFQKEKWLILKLNIALKS